MKAKWKLYVTKKEKCHYLDSEEKSTKVADERIMQMLASN